MSQEKLRSVTADPSFQKLLTALHREKADAEQSDAWFQKAHPRSGVSTIAYFSMEFMLSEALPIYSGGLGNVAGDQLKAASNLGVPVTGISLLYQQGYFRQEIDAQGQPAGFVSVQRSRPAADQTGADAKWRMAAPGPSFAWF